MNYEEYKKIKQMSVIDRIVFMNSGTLSENLKNLIDLSDWEAWEEENKCQK